MDDTKSYIQALVRKSSIDRYIFAVDSRGNNRPYQMKDFGKRDSVRMLIDSGAEDNVIDEVTFNKLRRRDYLDQAYWNYLLLGLTYHSKPLESS